MLHSKRSVLGLVVVTSLLAGCGTTTIVQSGSGSDPAHPAGPARTLSFAQPTPYDASHRRVSVMHTLDFDGDGHLDIAVTSGGGSVGVMRNAGDGTFEDIVWQTEPGAVSGYTVLEVGDLNGDGLGDLVFTSPPRDSADGGIYVIFGSADGKVAAPAKLRHSDTGDPAGPLHVADMNGDGIPDVIDVDHHERHGLPGDPCHADRACESRVEDAPVLELRERVGRALGLRSSRSFWSRESVPRSPRDCSCMRRSCSSSAWLTASATPSTLAFSSSREVLSTEVRRRSMRARSCFEVFPCSSEALPRHRTKVRSASRISAAVSRTCRRSFRR